MKALKLGKREVVAPGVIREADGTFLAITLTQSKTFKTKAAAVRWFAAQMAE